MISLRAIELKFIAIYFNWNFESSFLNYVGLDITTARKTVFPMSWNIMQSSKRRSKYHLPNTFLAEKRLYSPSPKISKQELISVISKYYLFHQLPDSKKDHISHHQKVQKKNFSVISKYHLSINFWLKKYRIFQKFQNKNFLVISKHHIPFYRNPFYQRSI